MSNTEFTLVDYPTVDDRSENNLKSSDRLKQEVNKEHTICSSFSILDFYLFKLKHLCGMTYKELSEKTKIPNSRKKVLTVMHWLKKNVTKKEIEKKFDETYGYLIS